MKIIFTSYEIWNDSLKNGLCFSSAEFSILGITCSTIDARRPRARPHSSPRVTTALPSFTTILFACFSSLRWAKRLAMCTTEGHSDKGDVAPRTNMSDGWGLNTTCRIQSQMQEKKRNTWYNFSLKICMQNSNQFSHQKIVLPFSTEENQYIKSHIKHVLVQYCVEFVSSTQVHSNIAGQEFIQNLSWRHVGKMY